MSAVVIGGAGSIGQACVKELLSSHDFVYSLDLVPPSFEGVHGLAIDVTDRDQVNTVIDLVDKQSPIQSLIYAAGLNATGPIDSINWMDFDRLMAVNLQGAFHIAAAIQRRMRETKREIGIVFISSTAGIKGEAEGAIYCATKFGMRGFVESFAAEIAALDGRANTVCPGNVESHMLTELAQKIGVRTGKGESGVLADLAASSAFGRLITTEEVARTCVWLASVAASGISGQTIVVDGPPAL